MNYKKFYLSFRSYLKCLIALSFTILVEILICTFYIAVHVNDTSLNWKTRWNRDIPAGSNQCELWIFCFIASETDRKHSGLSILVASQWANSAPHYYNIDCCLKSVKTLLYKNCGVVLSMFQLMSFECFSVTISPST